MRDIVMQPATIHVDKPPYTMQLLLEEVTALRSRVKELEEDGASRGSGRTAPSLESHEPMENQEVVVLRKQLMKVESDRANLEKDFMNQLSMLAQENRENVEKLQKKLKMAESEKNIIKVNGSFEQSEEVWELEQEVKQLKAVIAANGEEGLQQVVRKLSTVEKELRDVQEQNKSLHEQVEELDSQNVTLLEEITHLRLDYDREVKTATSLRTEMEEMAKDFDLQLEKFQHDFMDQEEAIQRHEESFGNVHDTVVELEGQKALLLDEITGLRLELDREKQTKTEMKERIEELTKATVEAGEIKAKDAAEKQHETASMVSQRISYEKRSTRSIMDHVAEVDDLRRHVSELEGEVSFLKNKLHEVKMSPFGEQQMTPVTRSSPRPCPRLSTPTRRRSSSASFHFPPPPPSAPMTPPRAMSRAELDQQRIGPWTPVRDIAKKIERSIASGSSQGMVGNDRDRPTDESDISVSSAEAEAFAHKADFESQQVRDVQEKLQKQSELVGELQAEIATLTATRGAQAIIVQQEYADKSRVDEERITSLTSQLEDTRCQLESETELVKALREELNILASEKVANAGTGGSSPERLKALALERNKLANAVTAAQMEKTNMERELTNTIRALEDTIESMNAEIDAELAEKQAEIDTLQRKLDNQIEMVKRMEKEREQICMNINSVSNSKKVEIDELHEELMATTATAAAQARQINSLMVQVEKQKDDSEELEYLRMKLRDLEKRSNDTGMSRDEMDKLWSENQRLNDSLRKMSLERRALQEKLSAMMTEKSASKSVQVLRERNTALKKEVERLSRRVRQSEVSANTKRIEI